MRHSLYLHIPFCAHRCAYCDFNTYAGQEHLIPRYVGALCREIEWVGRNAPDDMTLHTVFFGGGTPSLLSPEEVGRILDAIRRTFRMAVAIEVSLEANPGTVSVGALRALRKMGITRLSYGVQSANGEELRMLERQHNFLDVLDAVSAARRAGFDNLNVDLIYGLPEQSMQTWQSTVRRTLELNPEHLSAYALTLEHGTPFGAWSARGLLPMADPDLAAEMYEWISDELESAGYVQYEISNWAREGYTCRHNLQYWRGLPYLGLGAGAHGYAGGYRYSNVLGIRTYVERITESRELALTDAHEPRQQPLPFPLSPAAVNQYLQTARDDMSEFMITGLRLTREGVAGAVFRQKFGIELKNRYEKEIAELTNVGLLELVWPAPDNSPVRTGFHAQSSEVLRLTKRGRLLGNQVFVRFLG